MKYAANLSSIIFVTFGIIAFPLNETKRALAIGCDTYYRVTGQIAGCSDLSTEFAREVWLERYSVCLQQQLSREISIYNNQLETYYTKWNKDAEQNITLNNISFQEQNTSPLSLSQTQSATY
ncbi:MAG TPA: hypothetical protein V6C71_11395 [Coleofasciculaceae cyanobacterium]|jgi:hypothetical protein